MKSVTKKVFYVPATDAVSTVMDATEEDEGKNIWNMAWTNIRSPIVNRIIDSFRDEIIKRDLR